MIKDGYFKLLFSNKFNIKLNPKWYKQNGYSLDALHDKYYKWLAL